MGVQACVIKFCVLFLGAVVLQISCFSEAERIYMLAKDISISGKPLCSLVIPDISVQHHINDNHTLIFG